MTVAAISSRPPEWDLFARALRECRPVRAHYRGANRVLCPHVLGWKDGRPKVLAYQVAGYTSQGGLPQDPRQRWRSMFVDEITMVVLTDDHWKTAGNYSPRSNGIDRIELAVRVLN
jgi:hypothetical protein